MGSNNIQNYIFVDESGDPGKPFKTDSKGSKIPTGASLYYILSSICVDSKKLFAVENKILEIRQKYKYRSEIKSTTIPLKMYKDLLKIIDAFEIHVHYRLVDKKKYKGVFSVNSDKKLHNVFDEYNLAKLCKIAIQQNNILGVDVVIDRADRRLLDGNFESFNEYLKSKVNTKTIRRIEFVTHVDSKYVNVMQLSDLVSGAIKDHFTGKNKDFKKIISRKYLHRVI